MLKNLDIWVHIGKPTFTQIDDCGHHRGDPAFCAYSYEQLKNAVYEAIRK